MFVRIDSVLREKCGLKPDNPVLVGVSGGPDSLCLLDILNTAGYPVIVAHFNHKLRPEADLEAASVESLARSLGLPFVSDSADVAACADVEGISVEEAARTLRYRFLFAQARQHSAQAVAVGHTADDQVETVLMHFLRGAGLAGLKGMEYKTILPVFDPEIPLVRPLLELWRLDTETYCREHGLQPHFDASNVDQTYFRNRLRLRLIPELEKYNPRFREALLRTALAMQGDFAALKEVLDAVWKDSVAGTGDGWVAFHSCKLAQVSVGLRRNLIRRAAESLRPDNRDFGFDALERAAVFVETPTGKQMDFVNGLYLFIESGKTCLAAWEADIPLAQWPQVNGEHELVVGDSVALADSWRLAAEKIDGSGILDQALNNENPFQAWLDWDQISATLVGGNRLTIHAALAGEHFQPLGMNGHSIKFSDFFVNVKLPKRARQKWPIVYAGDVPIWVPGFRLSHPFRVTEKTRRAVRFALRKKQG